MANRYTVKYGGIDGNIRTDVVDADSYEAYNDSVQFYSYDEDQDEDVVVASFRNFESVKRTLISVN